MTEFIFQIGNTEDTHCGTPEADIAANALTDFITVFQEHNPNIRVFNAVIHLDEETPHVHINFIPFATEQKRGLSTRNSLSKALEQLDSDIKDKSAKLESTAKQLAADQQLLQVTPAKVAQINDLDSIEVKRSMFGDKVTLAGSDYVNLVDLAKKEIAAEHDTAAKDDEIYCLNEILQALNKEKALLIGERSALQKTIDRLRAQVRELSDQLSVFKGKYAKVMEFIEKFDLKEKLDKFLHPIKNMKKHR